MRPITQDDLQLRENTLLPMAADFDVPWEIRIALCSSLATSASIASMIDRKCSSNVLSTAGM
jgi:hypothetical protein